MKVFIALSTATLGAATLALPLAANAAGGFGGGRPAMMAPMGGDWHGTVINPDLIRGDRGGFGSGVGGDRSGLSNRTGVRDTRPPTRTTPLAPSKAERRGLAPVVRPNEGLAPPRSDVTQDTRGLAPQN
jgi:hypothetical protein